jgi:twitching motility protein PilU
MNNIDVLLPDAISVPPLNEILRLMADKKASDAFISVGAQIKIKINGRQIPLMKSIVNKDDIDMMLVDGLDSDQLSTLDTKKELNCALSIPRIGRFRLSAFVQRNTKACVIRYIPHEIPLFETLGLPDILPELVMMKRGLILVVGPTGSGKSTTLASLVDHRNQNRNDHIITLEDPIEFLFKHKSSVVNQREIGTDAFSYQEALRNALRQAPDVILIGEIRDQETMNMAMQYAQSGHLCLATMHANNSYHAIGRIVGFYDPEYRDALFQDLSNSLKAIIAQRLIPTIDNSRKAAIEILVNSVLIQELIEKGKISDIPEAMLRSMATGTQTFEQELIKLVKNKHITVENALIYSDSPSNLFWALSNMNLHIDETAAKEAGIDRDKMASANKDNSVPGDSDDGSRKKESDIFSSISLNTENL